MAESFYQTRLQQLQQEARRLSRNIRWIGWARVVTFGLIVYLLYTTVKQTTPLIFMLSIYASAGLFLGLLWIHQKQFDAQAFTLRLILLNQYELTGKGIDFADGKRYQETDALANDLDIAGHGSLFHQINRCATHTGEDELFRLLTTTPKTPDEIRQLQEAVQALASQATLRQDIFAHVYRSDMEQTPRMTRDVRYTGAWHLLIQIWPVISVLLITASFVLNQEWLLSLPLFIWIVVIRESKYLQQVHIEIAGSGKRWKSYSRLFDAWNNQSFSCKPLQQMQHDTASATHAFKQLARITEFLDQRSNALMYFLMNTVTLFELRYVRAYEQWKLSHYDDMNTWMKALGKMEAFASLGTFAFNHPAYTYPTLHTQGKIFEVADMGHPLLKQEACVTNALTVEEHTSVLIITGSNMSGKSTFLRALGLNTILAQAGAPVFASRFELTPLRLLTSFRQQDSVQESTSYFMAELKRLRQITEQLDHPGHNLILLDEILRGTNSDDKTYGSQALLEKLKNTRSLTILATHDLQLAELEKQYPRQVLNYCFESEIMQNDLRFDYRIRRGVAQNRNATFLMRKIGIID
jgi:DNA mismatch repair ATPase MutS